ncbi:MAG TPA: ABC transporter ATP-binding protein, partial [Candidatus Paceibacterota bacterium]
MILVKSLEKEYYSEDGRVLTNALRGIDLEIKSGDFLAIMGPSGSGKSTLLHILSFLDRPTKGTYHFLDREISELSDEELASIRNKKMGFVFQAFNLLGRMSVYENIEIPLMYSDTPADKRKNAIERVIKSVDLMDKIG